MAITQQPKPLRTVTPHRVVAQVEGCTRLLAVEGVPLELRVHKERQPLLTVARGRRVEPVILPLKDVGGLAPLVAVVLGVNGLIRKSGYGY